MPAASKPKTVPQPARARSAPTAEPLFFGLIDAVIVPDPAAFDFDGALCRSDSASIWTWMARDLAPDLIDARTADFDRAAERFADRVPEISRRALEAIRVARLDPDSERRFKTQLGGEEAHLRIPIVLTALKARGLLGKAQSFGRAVSGMGDETALTQALQAMPLGDQAVAPLLMQAAVGQVLNPSRLVTAAIRLAGTATEPALLRAGFGRLVDAILCHAQAQIPALEQIGPFADVDLTCRAIDRFHRLMRGIITYVELERASHWSTIAGALTKRVSELIEPRLRDVPMDVNRALRRFRDGTDRLDGDQILSALNGCYLLATVRDCRDSLALNAAFEEIWAQLGQALEIHVQRNLESFRQTPSDRIIGARLDAAIKMCELRFSAEYADVLKRARDSVERRTA
jgi:hypothetical protein